MITILLLQILLLLLVSLSLLSLLSFLSLLSSLLLMLLLLLLLLLLVPMLLAHCFRLRELALLSVPKQRHRRRPNKVRTPTAQGAAQM